MLSARQSIATAIALSLALAGVAHATDAPVQSIQQVLGQGFEIKAVSIVPTSMMTALGYKLTDPPKVLVTLQRGAAVAVCEVSLVNWDTLPDTTLQNTKICSIVHEGAAPPPPAPAAQQQPAPGAPATPAPEKPPQQPEDEMGN